MTLTWKFLLQFDFSKPLPNQRSSETIQKYNNFKKLNKDICSYIKNKYLNNCDYCIIKNDFPYDTEKDVKHYILWIKDSFLENINKRDIEDLIQKKMLELEYSNYIYFENHISVQTVPDIKHFQIFYKK